MAAPITVPGTEGRSMAAMSHEPAPVRVGVLGPLLVDGPAGEVAIRGRIAAAFAFLALHRGRAVSLTEISAANGVSPRALRTGLRAIGAELPDDVVVVTAGQARLNLTPEAVDADRFRLRLRQARRHWDTADYHACATICAAAHALWRADPYPELVDCLDALPEIHRLQEQYLDLTELRMETVIRGIASSPAAGSGTDSGAAPAPGATEFPAAAPDYGAITELAALVGDHPERRGFRLQLARALHLAGRQVEALRILRQATIELGDSLATRRIAALIASRDPAVAATATLPASAGTLPEPRQQPPGRARAFPPS